MASRWSSSREGYFTFQRTIKPKRARSGAASHHRATRKFDLRTTFRATGMFAHALSAPRLIVPLIAALAAVSGCGGQVQSDNEPEGDYKLAVSEASFPAKQAIAEQSTMRIRVRNEEQKTIPDVAVTVETKGSGGGGEDGAGLTAFGQKASDSRLADPNRPIWVLDQEPRGGTSAYSNTWTLGPLEGGETKTFEWKLTAVEPGTYSLAYKVAPGLDGKAKLADGSKADGTFDVTVTDEPIPARVNSKGEVVRGEQAGAGKD
jgi:hypothetical protein